MENITERYEKFSNDDRKLVDSVFNLLEIDKQNDLALDSEKEIIKRTLELEDLRKREVLDSKDEEEIYQYSTWLRHLTIWERQKEFEPELAECDIAMFEERIKVFALVIKALKANRDKVKIDLLWRNSEPLYSFEFGDGIIRVDAGSRGLYIDVYYGKSHEISFAAAFGALQTFCSVEAWKVRRGRVNPKCIKALEEAADE